MAQVGHEVAAHLVGACAFGAVGDHRHRTQGVAVAGHRVRADLDHLRRRAGQLYRAGARVAVLGLLEQLRHPCAHQRHRVAGRHHLVGPCVAGAHGAVLVYQHHAHRQLVHGVLPARPVPLGQVGRDGRRGGHRLQVGDPVVEALVVDVCLGGAGRVVFSLEAVDDAPEPLRGRRALPHRQQHRRQRRSQCGCHRHQRPGHSASPWSRRARARLAPRCSGSWPVTRNSTRWAMFTAWSPMRS